MRIKRAESPLIKDQTCMTLSRPIVFISLMSHGRHVQIFVKNIFSNISTKDDRLLRQIRAAFTFEESRSKYARHAFAQHSGKWAYGLRMGTSFVSEGGRFGTGMLPDVTAMVFSLLLPC